MDRNTSCGQPSRQGWHGSRKRFRKNRFAYFPLVLELYPGRLDSGGWPGASRIGWFQTTGWLPGFLTRCQKNRRVELVSITGV